MNTTIWIIQSLIAATFMYSGIQKSLYSEQKLVASGQTGVEGLSPGLIRFIGISEIFGSIGLIIPMMLNTVPVLTPISAFCLGVIMIPAAVIHNKRHEPKNVITNCILFLMCAFIVYGRISLSH